MSHLVCACAYQPKARASAPISVFALSMLLPPWPRMLAQFLAHAPREREARREAGRLDAVELHESRHAMAARSLDLEVGRRLAGSRSLRPNARVARRERAVGQSRPVAADRPGETIGAARGGRVIDAPRPIPLRPRAPPSAANAGPAPPAP